MNENDRQQSETSSTQSERHPSAEMAVTLGDNANAKAPHAPLVDAVLEEVSQRDESLSASLSDDLAAMQTEIDSLRDRMAEMSSHAIDTARSGAKSTARSARRAVRRNPVMVLGIAATVGYLLGLSARR